ncbi:MAG: hypothetical protein L0346_34745, partial [Chloroflexi bacterium]|nr:hypothetical protein [Chloroflexota bacterium]
MATSSGSVVCIGSWETYTAAYVLEANEVYTVTFSRGSTELDYVDLDNFSLTVLHDETEIDQDTGIITNGEFIGPDAWTYHLALHYMN